MSRETSLWLNQNTLIGDTDKRGRAWHYREASQGVEPNHYSGAIPVADVERRLFDWEPVEAPLFVGVPAGLDGAGEPYYDYHALPERKAIVPSDRPTEVLGMFKSGYQIHSYREWLLTNVANLVDEEVHISSAGLLKNRAVAWVEISLSEVHSVAGFDFRPHLLASTSVDGSLATQYGRKVQAVVCDNTLDMATKETGQLLKIKHSKYSKLRLSDARDALNLIVATADEFSEQVEALTSWKVSDKEWSQFLDSINPTQNTDGVPLSKIAVTKAENKRERLTTMYRSDMRCAPWSGTALGVLQTLNTWEHHERPTRGTTNRVERNMIEAINGTTAKSDADTLKVLATVTGRV
jgi:phage/plasmid-like protein (TIGR03299 family)